MNSNIKEKLEILERLIDSLETRSYSDYSYLIILYSLCDIARAIMDYGDGAKDHLKDHQVEIIEPLLNIPIEDFYLERVIIEQIQEELVLFMGIVS